MVYKWRDGYPYARRVPAQKAASHLEALRLKNNGRLSARLVVSDAKSERSPLHSLFTWDNRKAAEAHRLQQANALLSCIVVEKDDDGNDAHNIRAFVVVSGHANESYTSIAVALSDPTLRTKILQDAFKELESWRKRYSDLEEMAEVFKAIEMAKIKAG